MSEIKHRVIKRGLALGEETGQRMGGTLRKEVRQWVTGKQTVSAEQLAVEFHIQSNSAIKVQNERIITCCLNSESF